MDRPALGQFRGVYYDRSLDYWDIADTFGVDRWQIDEWRRELGLPSRRWYGSFRPGRDEDFVMPDGRCRWDYFSGRVGSDGWWDRRRLPGSGILVFPGRRVGRSVYYECC